MDLSFHSVPLSGKRKDNYRSRTQANFQAVCQSAQRGPTLREVPHGTATSIDASKALESADDAFRDYVDSLVGTKAT
jgi:hypothetical protein